MPTLGPIRQIALTVTDLPRAVAFYRDLLELPLLFEVPNLAFFDCHGVRLMLGPAEGPEGGTHSSVLYFTADDITTTHRTLAGRGVPFDREPHLIARMPDHELWMAFFRDPDRNLLAILEERRDGNRG